MLVRATRHRLTDRTPYVNPIVLRQHRSTTILADLPTYQTVWASAPLISVNSSALGRIEANWATGWGLAPRFVPVRRRSRAPVRDRASERVLATGVCQSGTERPHARTVRLLLPYGRSRTNTVKTVSRCRHSMLSGQAVTAVAVGAYQSPAARPGWPRAGSGLHGSPGGGNGVTCKLAS